MIKRITAVAFVACLAAPAVKVQAEWNHPLPYDWYVNLARCETQNNTRHKTRSYVGAFGHARSTWDAYADTPNSQAHTLTFAQQARVLDRTFFFGHTERGRRLAPAGPFGHGCFKYYWKTSTELRSLVCNNAKQSVRRWCRK